MNKTKELISEMRRYLGRDIHGLELLDKISEDVNAYRKKIVLLQESVNQSSPVIGQLTQDKCNAEKEVASLKQDLEAETARLASARKRQEDLAARLKRIESATEVDEEVPVDRRLAGLSPTFEHVARISKEVRKRFRTIPEPVGNHAMLRLESVVTDFSGEEFMALGMLLTMLALNGFPAGVQAERTLRDMDGFHEKHVARFVHWYRSWIRSSANEDKVYGGSRKGKTIKHRCAE